MFKTMLAVLGLGMSWVAAPTWAGTVNVPFSGRFNIVTYDYQGTDMEVVNTNDIGLDVKLLVLPVTANGYAGGFPAYDYAPNVDGLQTFTVPAHGSVDLRDLPNVDGEECIEDIMICAHAIVQFSWPDQIQDADNGTLRTLTPPTITLNLVSGHFDTVSEKPDSESIVNIIPIK